MNKIAFAFRSYNGDQKASAVLRLAETENEQRTGLSKTAELSPISGMFFKHAGSFWMPPGMRFPLDIVFTRADGKILEKKAMPMDNGRGRYFPTKSGASHAIELPLGFCDKYGIKPGDYAVPVHTELNTKHALSKSAQEITGNGRGFILRPGQTITHAMRAHNKAYPDTPVTIDDIRAANNGIEDSKYTAGKEYLFRKPEAEYTVVSGDVLSRIARKHGTTVNDIVKLNNLASADKLKIGQKLRIPATSKSNGTSGSKTNATVKAVSPVAVPVDAHANFDTISRIVHEVYKNPLLESALLSNMFRETGGTFSHKQWQHLWKKDPVTGKSYDAREGVKFDTDKKQYGGYGLYQLTGKNQTNYKNWLVQNNLEDSATNQVKFVNEVFGPNSYPEKWKQIADKNKTLSAPEYSKLIHEYLLRPGYVVNGNKNRISAEEAKMDKFRKGLVHTRNGWSWPEITNSVPSSSSTNATVSAQKQQ